MRFSCRSFELSAASDAVLAFWLEIEPSFWWLAEGRVLVIRWIFHEVFGAMGDVVWNGS